MVAVLDGISLHAQPGEFVSIIGPSGSGKSTLFNIAAGLEMPDAGEIRIDGEIATGKREKCAYMPQKDLLFPWRKVIDNTVLGLEIQGMRKKQARAKAAPLFATFGLTGFENAYAFQLSGGMRQRAALLRTVIQDRSVLLLDEPFGALDSLTRTSMQAWLTQVWETYEWTVLLVTHDIQEAVFLSDRVYVLTRRPARIDLVVEIALPRPRSLGMLGSPEFAHFEKQLFQALVERQVAPSDASLRATSQHVAG